MTIMGLSRDRCRLCFSLIGRDRSLCCQKSFHLFKHIERHKLPSSKFNASSMQLRNRTVCLHDLLRRYLHTPIHPLRNSSNLICAECSISLLDIEQCAKYLRKTINQLKLKLNKSTRLQTSSLSATFQKKYRPEQNLPLAQEQLPINSNSDSDDQFDDLEDDEDSDEMQDENKGRTSMEMKSAEQSNSPVPLLAGDSSSSIRIPQVHSIKTDKNNDQCNDDDDVEEDDDDDDDDEDEDGSIKASHSQHSPMNTNGFPLKAEEMNNPNLLHLRLSQMMGSAGAAGQHFNDPHHLDSAINTFAHMQRNILFQFLNDPLAAAQAAQAAAAAAAALSATPIKANLPSLPLLTSNNINDHKQSGSGRKRKSTPEKRVVTNHRSSTNNNGNTSPNLEQDAFDATMKDTDSLDHPLELTLKNNPRVNASMISPTKSTSHVQNLVMNSMLENGGLLYHPPSAMDEDRQESTTPNDSSVSLSPSLIRRSTTPKRAKLSNTSGQYETSQATDLLSPNHHPATHEDPMNSSKQARKLDPRSCTECGKILFSDKTHLVHCQSHAKNEKLCWICGAQDDDMKKHILAEHGNQKFTNAGFKCQHCDRVFPIFADLEMHTQEHSKKKPFECPICHKRFGQQGNLSCHLRIHSGVKPFSCAHCGKAFRHSNSLRRHARTVHSASRGLTMSPTMATATTPSSLVLSTATSSNSMVAMADNLHRLNANDAYEDGPSGLLIASDEGESFQDQGSPSTSISNAPIDSDSPEQQGLNESI